MKGNMTGAYTICLAQDMRTVVSQPRLVVPAKTNGTPLEGHANFEAAFIRKLKGRYYFIFVIGCKIALCLNHDRPKYFVMENVATIRNTDSFRKVIEHFPAAGYGLTKMILDVSVLLFYDFFQK